MIIIAFWQRMPYLSTANAAVSRIASCSIPDRLEKDSLQFLDLQPSSRDAKRLVNGLCVSDVFAYATLRTPHLSGQFIAMVIHRHEVYPLLTFQPTFLSVTLRSVSGTSAAAKRCATHVRCSGGPLSFFQ